MNKKLSEMSLEELWQLFPIFLEEYNESWKQWYKNELLFIENVLPLEKIKKISHIGSTSIENIWAKPIIDILIESYKDQEIAAFKDILIENGYICMSEEKERISLNKGYTEKGFEEKVFHVHLRCEGDNDELYFRDYLISFPEKAREYESLKISLWKKFEHDRDGYTNSKTDFIKDCTQKAKEMYGSRYL